MKWLVYTPTYERIRASYSGPGEYGSDTAEVSADTRREALVRGLRELRRSYSSWVSDQESDGHSPFHGLKAEPLEDICTKQVLDMHEG